MIDHNQLFLDAFVYVNHYLKDNGYTFFPTSMGKYIASSGRDPFACMAFIKDGERYYIYFNSGKVSGEPLNEVYFTSLSLCSYNPYTLLNKVHVNTVEDVRVFMQHIETL